MDQQRTGIALRIVSGLCITAMTLCVKAVTDEIALGQIVFFRSFFAFPILIGFLWVTGSLPAGLKTKNPMGHAWRSIFGATAMFTGFAALKFLPVAEATMISYLFPVFMIVLAVLVLGEQAGKRQWIGVGLGMSGVFALTLSDMEFGVSQPRMIGLALGITTAVLGAAALIQVRRLSATEHPGAIAFYFALMSVIAGAMTVPLGWSLPSLENLALLIAAGLFGGMAHVAMVLAFRSAEASTLAPFEYLTLIWAAGGGFVFFGEHPSVMFYLAAVFILSGVVIATKVKPAGRVVNEVAP